jgi:hypothetical protein
MYIHVRSNKSLVVEVEIPSRGLSKVLRTEEYRYRCKSSWERSGRLTVVVLAVLTCGIVLFLLTQTLSPLAQRRPGDLKES